METLMVVEQHRNQYCGRVKVKNHSGPGRGVSPVTRRLRGVNCRSFESGVGVLATPSKRCTGYGTNHGYSSPSGSPRIPSPMSDSKLRSSAKSAPIAIKSRSMINKRSFEEEFSDLDASFSELWAGPTYSNSPPPSSLPIPKFSLLPRRTVSLELPNSAQDSKMEMLSPTAKSAPASPSGESRNDRFDANNFGTKDLCRILNLEIAND